MEENIKMFKDTLKDMCSIIEELIEEYSEKYNSIINNSPYSGKKMQILLSFGVNGATITSEQMQRVYNETGIMLSKEEEEYIAVIYSAFKDYVKKDALEKFKNKIRQTINVFDVNKVKAPLDISYLLVLCSFLHRYKEIDNDVLCRLFGMAVSFNASRIDASSKSLSEDEKKTLELSKYFNEDGTFAYNTKLEIFKDILIYFKNQLKQDKEILQEFEVDEKTLDLDKTIESFAGLLYLFNATYEREALKTNEISVIFKDGLRRCIRDIDKIIENYESQAISLDANMTDKEESYLSELGVQKMDKPLLPLRHNAIITGGIGTKISRPLKILNIRENKEMLNWASALRYERKRISHIISACDVNKIKEAVNICTLVIMLEQMRSCQGTPINVLCKAFGMAIYTTALKGDASDPFIEEVKNIAAFHNEDGSFIEEKSHTDYFFAIKELIDKINGNLGVTVFTGGIGLSLAYDFTSLYLATQKTNEIMQGITIIDDSKRQNLAPAKADRKDLSELKQYYSNGEILKIPENMLDFEELLDRCLLNDQEKTFILGLVNAKVSAVPTVDPLENYLVGEEWELYQAAKAMIDTINYTHPLYHLVVEGFNELPSLCELLAEEVDEESLKYLTELKSSYMSAFSDLVYKGKKPKKTTSNNLIFLGDYFENDLVSLDKVKQKRVLSGLPRIIKDNQSNFRKVLTSENIDVIPYDLQGGGIRIPFVEIDSGIYLILGCDTVGEGYRKTINRIIKERRNIAILEDQIKDEKRRMDLLIEGEEKLQGLTSKSEGRK